MAGERAIGIGGLGWSAGAVDVVRTILASLPPVRPVFVPVPRVARDAAPVLGAWTWRMEILNTASALCRRTYLQTIDVNLSIAQGKQAIEESYRLLRATEPAAERALIGDLPGRTSPRPV